MISLLQEFSLEGSLYAPVRLLDNRTLVVFDVLPSYPPDLLPDTDSDSSMTFARIL